uniref:Caveolin n=1 Tax=Macrostomum lignano TaxID=282301 RepID=A0A1I8H327_9PLAT
MAKEGEEAKVEVDLVNRDPNQLNGHLKVAFEDVLGEPEHAHSIDCLWRNSYGCFTGGKNCCYKFVSVLSGLCIALCWGCTFAMVFKIFISVFREMWETYWDCCVGAECKAYGYFFSRVKVQQG